MSRFFSEKYKNMIPYTPGEQPTEMKYVKLNTNESPFPPSPKAQSYAAEAAQRLQLYPDPECKALNQRMAERFGVATDEILMTNGSDEILNFAFMAFCDDKHPAAFPDISYGFYPVFADINHIPYREIPLQEDFSINVEDYLGTDETLVIANPNAPTGMILPVSEIERILQSNPNRVVVVDEAYIDFGGESCIPLVHKYDNLLVTQTFSKSRSMAGARLGFGIGCKELIRDLNTVKYSTNPYNINQMTMAAGIGVLEDEEYTQKNCATICENRADTTKRLEEMGFSVLPSYTNFVFAKHPTVPGETIYKELKSRGILVRHFTKERIAAYNRITIGTKEQMDILLTTLAQVLEELQ